MGVKTCRPDMPQIFRFSGFQEFRFSGIQIFRFFEDAPIRSPRRGRRTGFSGRQKLPLSTPEWPQVAVSVGGQATGHGLGWRVVMGASGGTSLCTQSGQHFCEWGWVGDCLIIEEPQPDFFMRQAEIRF
jgi:hypothetical protein